MLTAIGLRQVYGGRTVLDLGRLEARPGEILAIMGPSGSGKTTFLRIAAALDPPAAGEVRLEPARPMPQPEPAGAAPDPARPAPEPFRGGPLVWGRNGGLGGAGRVAWRRRVGLVPQNPVLFSGSIRENVALGLWLRGTPTAAARHRVARVLDEVGLGDLAGARVASLSAGETQRVALAQVLVLEPEVLLLDEPTANLDPANVAVIERVLVDAARSPAGRRPAVVVVTHNVFQARRIADRTALLVGGTLVEAGDTRQVFENPSDPRTAAFVRGEMVC